MATLTRMQQRRGTAAQWTDANTILAAGEIGFETDTGYLKIGDGATAWDDLAYFKDASTLSAEIVGLAPEALDTLQELSSALGDDPDFLTGINDSITDLQNDKAALTKSASKPSTPSNGDMWFDTSNGQLFMYYNDGTSSQWFQI